MSGACRWQAAARGARAHARPLAHRAADRRGTALALGVAVTLQVGSFVAPAMAYIALQPTSPAPGAICSAAC